MAQVLISHDRMENAIDNLTNEASGALADASDALRAAYDRIHAANGAIRRILNPPPPPPETRAPEPEPEPEPEIEWTLKPVRITELWEECGELRARIGRLEQLLGSAA